MNLLKEEKMKNKTKSATADEKLAALSAKMKRERLNIEADFKKHCKKHVAGKKKGH